MVDKGVKVGSEGLDKIMPIVEKVGKVADTAGKVASLFGKKGEGRRAKDTRVLSGKQQLYKGGDMSVNAPYVGFDMATGKNFKRPVGGNSAELMGGPRGDDAESNNNYWGMFHPHSVPHNTTNIHHSPLYMPPQLVGLYTYPRAGLPPLKAERLRR